MDLLSNKIEELHKLSLITERLEMRILKDNELKFALDVYLNDGVRKQSGMSYDAGTVLSAFQQGQTNLKDALRVFHSIDEQLFITRMGVFLDGKVIGTLGFSEYSPEMMKAVIRNYRLKGKNVNFIKNRKWISYGLNLLPEYHGQGFGREITQRRLEFVFETLGADGVLVDIDSNNAASMGLSREFGFKPLGIKNPMAANSDLFFLLRGR